MKLKAFPPLLLLLAACSSAPGPQPPGAPVPANALPTMTVRPANSLTPLAGPSKAIAAPVIRVGMLTDQSSVSFPRIDGGYQLVTDSGAWSLRRGFTASAPLAEAVVRYGVQVAALSDKTSVDAMVARIQGETGLRVDAIFDPSAANGGLYRVVVGDFADQAAAMPARDDLVRRGFGTDLAIVRRPSDQPFEKVVRIVDDEGESAALRGASVLVLPATGETVSIAQKPYRTAARLGINSRGLLNVINELNLEDYLKGVVPAELGPTVYDELEALKAQAIAARTYAVRNMNGFPTEGFDICPGPACQAYSGFSGEHALSTRAVTETAGLIMTHAGAPIDALYTSTCGGETSDVATMFPGRSEPYLKRARCMEMEMISIAGRADSRTLLTEAQVNARLFEVLAGPLPQTTWNGSSVTAAVAAAARVIGWPLPAGLSPAVSSRRGDVLRHLAAAFELDTKARAVTLPEDRRYFFPQTAETGTPAHLAAAILVKFGVWPAQHIDGIDLDAAMPREELYGVLGSWLREHDAVSEVTGKIAAVSERRVSLKSEGKITVYDLPGGIPAYRRLGDRFQEVASLPVMIGDRAVIHRGGGGTPVAIVVNANYDGASFDRTSSYANWTRTYRADDLVKSIARRNPIRQLIGIRPLVVDQSQRIAELEVTAEEGRTFILRGLPVRWSLGVPDNLFVFEKTKDPDGMDRYTFFGKGWGHGTGLCQVGAYGMAFRGWTAERILRHFYAGIEIGAMKRIEN